VDMRSPPAYIVASGSTCYSLSPVKVICTVDLCEPVTEVRGEVGSDLFSSSDGPGFISRPETSYPGSGHLFYSVCEQLPG
jgi:hypothetical protein